MTPSEVGGVIVALIVAKTDISIFKKASKCVDEWGVPVVEDSFFVEKARVKSSYKSAGNPTVDGITSQDGTVETTLTFNGFVGISCGDKVEFFDDYDSKVIATADEVSFIKDFNGKILLTKAVVK